MGGRNGCLRGGRKRATCRCEIAAIWHLCVMATQRVAASKIGRSLPTPLGGMPNGSEARALSRILEYQEIRVDNAAAAATKAACRPTLAFGNIDFM